MPIFSIQDKKTIAPLFYGQQDTFIWSCLQGCMGNAYANSPTSPQSAQIILGDFCFFGGAVNTELIHHKPQNHPSNFIIMVPPTPAWAAAIQLEYGVKAQSHTRYATKKSLSYFDKSTLQAMASQLPVGYHLTTIDKPLYHQILSLPWAKDLCAQFPHYASYQANGIGVAALKDGHVVAGASSYSFYQGGIEIEIDTQKEERRKGLASACGAKLILKCLNQNLYPNWDAHNKESLALAQKLGYQLDKEYLTYEILGY